MNWYKKSTTEENNPYMEAVINEDLDTADRMVSQAATEAGYTIGPVFHGTDSEFNVFQTILKGGHGQVAHDVFNWFSTSESFAENYGYFSRTSKAVYLQPGNMWTVSFKDLEDYFNHNAEENTGKLYERLQQNGISVIKIDSQTVDKAFLKEGETHTVYGVADPEKIKSSNAITYNDEGEVIPLSKRFDSSNPDIRY